MRNEQRIKLNDARSYAATATAFGVLSEKYSANIAGHMLDLATLSSHDRMLDVGTGTGLLARMAAGRGAQALGIDQSSEMLEEARRRAKEQGFGNRCQFETLDAEALELNDCSFDVATSLFVIRHLPDPGRAVREMHRVLRPGGRVVITVGARPRLFSESGFPAVLGAAHDRLREIMGQRFTVPRALRSFLSGNGLEPANHHAAHSHAQVKLLLKAAGFVDIRNHWSGEQFSLSPKEFWDVQAIFDSEARGILARNEDRLETLKQQFIDLCSERVRQGGQLIYRTGAIIYHASR